MTKLAKHPLPFHTLELVHVSGGKVLLAADRSRRGVAGSAVASGAGEIEFVAGCDSRTREALSIIKGEEARIRRGLGVRVLDPLRIFDHTVDNSQFGLLGRSKRARDSPDCPWHSVF